MGAAVGEPERKGRTIRDISDREKWWGMLVLMSGKQPEVDLPLTGWVVDANKFDDLDKLTLNVIPLRPVEGWVLPSAAQKQLKSWEKQLGPTVYLLVPDTTQPDAWLAQPVPVDWITNKEVEWIFQGYQEARKLQDPKELMYRAAFIATRGYQPEDLASISHS